MFKKLFGKKDKEEKKVQGQNFDEFTTQERSNVVVIRKAYIATEEEFNEKMEKGEIGQRSVYKNGKIYDRKLLVPGAIDTLGKETKHIDIINTDSELETSSEYYFINGNILTFSDPDKYESTLGLYKKVLDREIAKNTDDVEKFQNIKDDLETESSYFTGASYSKDDEGRARIYVLDGLPLAKTRTIKHEETFGDKDMTCDNNGLEIESGLKL